MAHFDLTLPVTEAQVRALAVDDTVTLQGTLYGIRDATQIALFDRGRTTRFDLSGHAVIHTAPNVRKVMVSPAHPAGYAPVCVGTTTSMRMERFTRPLGTQCADADGAALEAKLSLAVNLLGVGPQGLGGDATAFAVHVELAATHITMNPVAVNMQCHSARRASALLTGDGVTFGF